MLMKYEIQNRLAENMKRLRKERKLTQFELAEKANISEAMVKSIELMHAWPSDKTLTQLSAALDVDILNFFLPTEDTDYINSTIIPEIEHAIRNGFNKYLEKIFTDLELQEVNNY